MVGTKYTFTYTLMCDVKSFVEEKIVFEKINNEHEKIIYVETGQRIEEISWTESKKVDMGRRSMAPDLQLFKGMFRG